METASVEFQQIGSNISKQMFGFPDSKEDIMFQDGIKFVNDLIQLHGLLEGYRIAEEYLKTPEDGSVEEAQYRQGIRFAMYKADQV